MRAVSRVCWLTTLSSDSFGPRVRSRVQWVSMVVGKEPSQIMPTCAPPSERPGTVYLCVSMA